ncbi:hypothetical protein SpCBS45565_g01351 [Spizellomyces sp. 'palustris']|nr:hypothetical protein SpCBS45565_g01351 [Spizellomyces sp. 'palustris']
MPATARLRTWGISQLKLLLKVYKLGVPLHQANSVVQQLNKDTVVSISALEALARERRRLSISTFSKAFDSMLGGSGVPTGRVTEVCGAPGMGKTQLGMQLCVNVQIPISCGGAEGEAIYIDTEGSFVVERVAEIARATYRFVGGSEEQEKEQVDEYLSRIHYFRIHGYLEQIALINQMDQFLKKHPNVKLMVIDSIAFHFRQNFTDMGLRTRLLNGMAQNLRRFADMSDMAVVLMNQMTTRITRGEQSNNNTATLVPALGDSWGHASTNRIILFWQRELRHAMIVKSPNLQQRTIQYAVTGDGIRDPPTTNPTPNNPRKRPLDE